MIQLRWREIQNTKWRWVGPANMATAVAARGAASAVVVIGPPGRTGDPGNPGPPGDGAEDPGDLTLIFNNQLI